VARFLGWTKDLDQEIGPAPAADLSNRFATPVDPPTQTTPVNILLDLDDVREEFVGSNRMKLKIKYEDACVDVRELPQPEGHFRHAFALFVNGAPHQILIRWDDKKRKYWLQCTALSCCSFAT